MKTKSIFPLFLLAGTLLTAACATPTAKQAGNNSFEWGQVPQQPDLSWADSVGSRQMPGNHVILSANSFGAVACLPSCQSWLQIQPVLFHNAPEYH